MELRIKSNTITTVVTGDSMCPKLLNGDAIVIREIKNREYFFWGHLYLIDTKDYRMLRYIRKHPTKPKEFVILHSENPIYEDIEISISSILKFYFVERALRMSNL